MAMQAARKEYLRRIHKSQDFIEQHLGSDLQLQAIAEQACFSPYHFHRIFAAITGETLYQFILRLRLEKAAKILVQQPARPITDIALTLGFSSSAVFARNFKAAFGKSASAFRKDCKVDSKHCKAPGSEATYLSDMVEQLTPSRRKTMSNIVADHVDVRDLPLKTLAYLRHVGPYAGNAELFQNLWDKFMRWAGPRQLLGPGVEAVTVYHDDPNITEEQKLRISVGVTVPPKTAISGEINLMEIPAGNYACALFEIDPSDYGGAWEWVMAEWLPQSGWQPSDAPAYECYLRDPNTHPEGKHTVEIRIGVQPLN